jgi:hypothetical protein
MNGLALKYVDYLHYLHLNFEKRACVPFQCADKRAGTKILILTKSACVPVQCAHKQLNKFREESVQNAYRKIANK